MTGFDYLENLYAKDNRGLFCFEALGTLSERKFGL